MTKFNKGDRVRRIRDSYYPVVLGETYTVKYAVAGKYLGVELVEFPGRTFQLDRFELVERAWTPEKGDKFALGTATGTVNAVRTFIYVSFDDSKQENAFELAWFLKHALLVKKAEPTALEVFQSWPIGTVFTLNGRPEPRVKISTAHYSVDSGYARPDIFAAEITFQSTDKIEKVEA